MRLILARGAILVLLVVCTIALAQTPARAGDLAGGKHSYRIYCARCHGFNGKGDGPTARTLNVKPRNFTDCAVMNKISDATLIKVIKGGGQAASLSDEMPPWGSIFNQQKVDALVGYIRSFCRNPN